MIGRLAFLSSCLTYVTRVAATEPNPVSDIPAEIEGARVDRLANTLLRGQINFAPDYRKANCDAISTSVEGAPYDTVMLVDGTDERGSMSAC